MSNRRKIKSKNKPSVNKGMGGGSPQRALSAIEAKLQGMLKAVMKDNDLLNGEAGNVLEEILNKIQGLEERVQVLEREKDDA